MSSNTSYKYDYSKANKVNDTPLFHVTPGKNCRMYPYIWTKDCAKLYAGPQKNPYICRSQGPVDSAQNYNGLPLFFEYNLIVFVFEYKRFNYSKIISCKSLTYENKKYRNWT